MSVWDDDVMMKDREARPGGTFVFGGGWATLGWAIGFLGLPQL